MESFMLFVVVAIILAVLLFALFWSIATNYFVKEGTTDELDVTKAVIVAVVFGVLWIALAYWGRDYVTY